MSDFHSVQDTKQWRFIADCGCAPKSSILIGFVHDKPSIYPGDSFDSPPLGIWDFFRLRLREAWTSVLQDERPGGALMGAFAKSFEDVEPSWTGFENVGNMKNRKIVGWSSFSLGRLSCRWQLTVEKKKEEKTEATVIKSRDPHLAAGGKNKTKRKKAQNNIVNRVGKRT